MSREQWGHGYWQGVKDERNGAVPQLHNIEELTHHFVKELRAFGGLKPIPVHVVKTILCAFGNLEEDLLRDIYAQIKSNPYKYGCYISSDGFRDWLDDDFVIMTD